MVKDNQYLCVPEADSVADRPAARVQTVHPKQHHIIIIGCVGGRGAGRWGREGGEGGEGPSLRVQTVHPKQHHIIIIGCVGGRGAREVGEGGEVGEGSSRQTVHPK